MTAKLQQPVITYNIAKATGTVGLNGQRVLVIGEAAGDVGRVVKNIQLNEIVAKLGSTSESALIVNRFRQYNTSTPIDVLTLGANTGPGIEGGIAAAGTATEAGVYDIYLADEKLKVSLEVDTGDTAEMLATKIAGINTGGLFTIAVDATDTTLTKIAPVSKSDSFNNCKILIVGEIAGVTLTAIDFTGTTIAADAPDFTNIDEKYQTIIGPQDQYDAITKFTESRFNERNAARGGVFFTGTNGTLADIVAKYEQKNERTATVFANPDECVFIAMPIFIATEFAAKRARRLTDGEGIADIVLDAVEATGGRQTASLPYHNTPIDYTLKSGVLTQTQAQSLTDAGVSYIIRESNQTVTTQLITTYKKDLSGIEDLTFKFLNYVDTALTIQEYLENNSKSRYGQTRATAGDVVSGRSMVNPPILKAFVVARMFDLIGDALVQDGTEQKKYMTDNTSITLEPATGKFKVNTVALIVTQLREIEGVLAIAFEI